jgi:hypothetical protein
MQQEEKIDPFKRYLWLIEADDARAAANQGDPTGIALDEKMRELDRGYVFIEALITDDRLQIALNELSAVHEFDHRRKRTPCQPTVTGHGHA